MRNDILWAFLVLLLIYGGLKTYFYRTWYSFKYGYVDNGPYHSVIGALFGLIGLIIICMAVKNIYDKNK